MAHGRLHKGVDMASITMSQVTVLPDPILERIALRIPLEAELAAAKVAASFQQPAEYPLTRYEASIERILESRFRTLPQEIKEVAATRAVADINAPEAERVSRYGDLANIDLRTDKAIDLQVQALEFPPELKLPADHPLTISYRRQLQVAPPTSAGKA
jgi:sporulation-control protein spo0M